MSRTQRLVGPLRALLVALFAALVITQVVALPALAAATAQSFPEVAPLRWPLLILAVAALACIEVVIVCTWRLLTMVRDDRIFSDHALVWVNGIVAAVAAAWLLDLAALVLLLTADGAGAGPTLALLLALVVGAAVALLMVVLRALLRQATELRTDLDGVI